MSRPRPARLLSLALASVAVFATGCARSPGDAFAVGDRSVPTSQVDDVVQGQCRLIKGQSQAQNQGQSQVVPRAKLTWVVVNAMLKAEIDNAYGDSHGSSYDAASLRQSKTQIATSVKSLPERERTALGDAITDSVRGQLIAVSVGRASLVKQGQAQPTDQESLTEGEKVTAAWGKKQGIEVNPRYNVGSSGLAGAGDGSISRAVSPFAKGSVKGTTTPAFLSGLSAGQRCG